MNNQKKIEFLQGERWWGGCVSKGCDMPYKETSDVTIDIYHHRTGNQTSPLFLSSKGRFIYCENGMVITFKDGTINVKSDDEIMLDESSATLKGAYQKAMELVKRTRASLPEKIIKQPQYNSWIELMYDQTQEDLTKYAHSIIENGYQPGVIMVDDNWQEDYGVWEFSGKRFKNSKKFVEELKELGFDVMLWVCPFISPDSENFRKLRTMDCLIKDQNGKPAIKEWWNGFSGLLDLTNPKAIEWFKQQLDNLVENYGVKGFKFDAGDITHYSDDDVTFEKITPANHVKKYSEFASKYQYNELRSGFNTAHLPLMQRLCDKNHSWGHNGVSSLLPHGLLQSLLGYQYNCPDMIGGGDYINFLPEVLNIDEELVVRYAQIAAFFPIMQFSVSPWRILSEKNNEITYNAAQLHLNLSDYILKQLDLCNKEMLPLMRYMEFDYPNHNFEDITSQFMLGEEILVAPVTTEKTYTKEVYLPEGKWLAEDGTLYNGDCKIEIEVPIQRVAYFVKQ